VALDENGKPRKLEAASRAAVAPHRAAPSSPYADDKAGASPRMLARSHPGRRRPESFQLPGARTNRIVVGAMSKRRQTKTSKPEDTSAPATHDNRICIIGCGRVGMASAYALIQSSFVRELVGSVKNLGRYAASGIAWWPKRPSSTAALT